ncbi:MAG: PLP-dependent aminotransferase family protein [Nocardioidaceae bacterium]
MRAALEDALRESVLSGRLPAGTRLPSSRSLATDLAIARNTVADAYAQLVAEGWLVARQGSGTRVADSASGTTPVQSRSRPAAPTVRFDLRPGHPDVASFPRTAWVAALRRALAAAPHETLNYGDPRGSLELRRLLASYLARVRGVRTTPDRLLVCSGTTQALALLAEVVGAPHGVIAVEECGLRHHRQVLERQGLSTLPVPVDDEGIDVRRLTSSEPSALLATPAHQFPLGVPLSPDRRADLVTWVRESRAVVIEDDYDGEFR